MTTSATPVALDDIVWDPQPYCDATLAPPYWKRTRIDGVDFVGKVCNTPVRNNEPCPSRRRHA